MMASLWLGGCILLAWTIEAMSGFGSIVIALSLGAHTVAAAAGAALPVLMADPDWKKRHAALITIAQVGAGALWWRPAEAGGRALAAGGRARLAGPARITPVQSASHHTHLQIAEGCAKVFVKQTDALTALCLQARAGGLSGAGRGPARFRG